MKYIQSFDTAAATRVAKIPNRYRPFLSTISNLGNFWLVTAVVTTLGIIALTQDRRELLASAVIMALLSPLAELVKLITRRKRPKTLYVEKMRLKTYSFPSSHAYVSAFICGYLIGLTFVYVSAPLSIVLAMALALFALTVGISRIYLGAHFPSDVLAGWLLAFIILVILVTSS